MPLGSSRSHLVALLAVLGSLPLAAARAGANEILIDDFSGTPALGMYTELSPNGLGQILPFTTASELDFLGDLLGMRLAYGMLGSVDLTSAGSNDALALEILSLVPSSGPVNLMVSVNGGASTYAVSITGTGTLPLPFDLFSNPSVFTSVDDLALVFGAGTSFSFAADDLRAIPEPRTAVMLGLGLLGLAFAGQRVRPAGARRGGWRIGSRP